MKRKGIVSVLALSMVLLITVGVVSIVAEYGASDDPLVTKSYIDSVLTPDMTAKIDAEIAKAKASLETYANDKINAHSATVDTKIENLKKSVTASLSQATIDEIANKVITQLKADGVSASGTWAVVNLPSGKTLKGKLGTEILVRAGSATASGNLVNTTSGSEISSGGAISNNSLYLVTSADKGIKATQPVIAVVSGDYTIS